MFVAGASAGGAAAEESSAGAGALAAGAAAALAFAVSLACKENEHVRFWAFCAFGACVGMYYPVQGMLRGRLISDEHRATVCRTTHLQTCFSLLTAVTSGDDRCRPCSACR